MSTAEERLKQALLATDAARKQLEILKTTENINSTTQLAAELSRYAETEPLRQLLSRVTQQPSPQ